MVVGWGEAGKALRPASGGVGGEGTGAGVSDPQRVPCVGQGVRRQVAIDAAVCAEAKPVRPDRVDAGRDDEVAQTIRPGGVDADPQAVGAVADRGQ